jgi:hypothetical protein
MQPFIVNFASAPDDDDAEVWGQRMTYDPNSECAVVGSGVVPPSSSGMAIRATGSTFTKAGRDPTRDEQTDRS